ncbi:hypothetical protein NLG97_g9292 [Lecanicillium saksenae]|uniref:Uncharacterized protein n=1 Tax=Lecanicillium saksenae TaxID=468837 RepID=A0ACC1QIW9_9HYPO|nr:hypothetical protein NLG97_g9292 [Lecanicillium saksenae]
MTSAADQAIDELLERYLGLVDQYARLRAELAVLQQGVFQNLARANFTSDRGARYGPDQYDERMQASRRLVVTTRADDGAVTDCAPTFAMVEDRGGRRGGGG